MIREAFEAALNALPAQKRWGTPKQLAWEAWQAARAAALEEAAKEADHWQQINGSGHRCGEYISGAIRALKDAP